MSPKRIVPCKSSIHTCSRCVAFALALAAAPLLAHAGESARDSDGDRTGQDAATVSIPLTGIGVPRNEHQATKPRPKDLQEPDERGDAGKSPGGGKPDTKPREAASGANGK